MDSIMGMDMDRISLLTGMTPILFSDDMVDSPLVILCTVCMKASRAVTAAGVQPDKKTTCADGRFLWLLYGKFRHKSTACTVSAVERRWPV